MLQFLMQQQTEVARTHVAVFKQSSMTVYHAMPSEGSTVMHIQQVSCFALYVPIFL